MHQLSTPASRSAFHDVPGHSRRAAAPSACSASTFKASFIANSDMWNPPKCQNIGRAGWKPAVGAARTPGEAPASPEKKIASQSETFLLSRESLRAAALIL